MTTHLLTDIIGWIGVVAYVAGYALLSFGYLKAESVPYHVLNGLGGCCLVFFSTTLHDVPNIVVNLVWILIAAYSLFRILRLRHFTARKTKMLH